MRNTRYPKIRAGLERRQPLPTRVRKMKTQIPISRTSTALLALIITTSAENALRPIPNFDERLGQHLDRTNLGEKRFSLVRRFADSFVSPIHDHRSRTTHHVSLLTSPSKMAMAAA